MNRHSRWILGLILTQLIVLVSIGCTLRENKTETESKDSKPVSPEIMSERFGMEDVKNIRILPETGATIFVESLGEESGFFFHLIGDFPNQAYTEMQGAKWKSDNPDVVELDPESGNVNFKKEGAFKIIATHGQKKFEGSYKIRLQKK